MNPPVFRFEPEKMINSEAIFNQLSNCIVILDAADKITYFNKGAVRFEHLARTRFQTGIPLLDIVSAERQTIVKTILEQVKIIKKPQVSEAEYKHPDGHSVFLEVTFNPILNKNNETEQICLMANEITHQKTFERKSVQLIRELSDLIENANALIFSVDSREYITEWNKECIHITGKEKNDALAQKVYAHLNEKCHGNFRHIMEKVLEGESVSNQELVFKTKGGKAAMVLMNATPKWNSTGNVVGVLLVGQDITELNEYKVSLEEKVKDRTEKLKQALEKEKELVDLKNRFVSVASHEFRIPLSTIASSAKSISTNPHLREEDVSNLNSVNNQIAHMKSLLDDILTIKKNETNSLKANFATIDIIAFLQKLTEEALENAKHSHQVRSIFAQPSIIIESDEKLLRNIFLNLLSNAIKFSPSQQDVVLTVALENDQLSVTVQDSGIGIAEKDLQKIFEPFQRGSNVDTIKGTGLGLYIVKKAVEALKGTLEIKTSVTTGTAITVTFMQTIHPQS